MKKPILTIAIPTYNRANLLKLALERINVAIKGYENDVEVIVSDNSSTDNIAEVITQAQKLFSFKYYRNSKNIGFNLNYVKLVDEYTTGKYCWVLGDDDFVHPNAIKEIVEVLQSHEDLSFVYVGFECQDLNEIVQGNKISICSKKRTGGYTSTTTFNNLTSIVGKPGNLMLTFISTAIFRSDLIKSLDKSVISNTGWDFFYNVFPHSFFYALSMKDRKAYVFNEPLIVAATHTKAWDSKIRLLYLKFIPELLCHYRKCGFSKLELRNQEKLIIRAGLPYLFKNIFSQWHLYKFKLFFIFHYAFDFYFYFYAISILIGKIKRKVVNS